MADGFWEHLKTAIEERLADPDFWWSDEDGAALALYPLPLTTDLNRDPADGPESSEHRASPPDEGGRSSRPLGPVGQMLAVLGIQISHRHPG